jgi:phage/plasmid-associated DNA primase
VQHPEQPAEVAVVLRGPQGSGKGAFARAFGGLFGEHFIHVSRREHLAGHFNAHLQSAIVVLADEAFLAGDRQAEGVLKMLITESRIPIEGKGRDVVFADNLVHLLIASNHDWVIPAGHDERRFAVLDVAPDHAQDHRYFAALAEEVEQRGGLAAMLHDLRAHDYSDVNLRQPPMTAGLFDQKRHSMDPAARWWFDHLMTGHLLPSLYPADEDWPCEVPRQDLWQDYTATIEDIGARSDRATQTELGQKLKKLLPEGFPREGRRSLPGCDKPVRFYGLPTLTECRDHFARTYLQPDFRCRRAQTNLRSGAPYLS